MGLELTLAGALKAAAAAASVGAQLHGQAQSREYQKEASNEAKEAKRVQEASELNANRAERRKAARVARVRRARLISQSQSSGASGSSGEYGAISALTSNFGSAVARQTSETQFSQAASGHLQKQADYLGKARDAEAYGDILSTTITSGSNLLNELDIFD